MSKLMESHYNWLEKNMENVCKNYGITYVNCLSSHGDKCSSVIHIAKTNKIPYYHACALFLLTYEEGIIQNTTRDISGSAKVNIEQWICENYTTYLYLFEECGDHKDCFK